MMLNTSFPASKAFLNGLKNPLGMEGDKMLYNMYFMINWLIFVKDRR